MELSTGILALAVVLLVVLYRRVSKRGPNVFERHGVPYRPQLSFYRQIEMLFSPPKAYAYHVQNVYNLNRDAKYVGMYHFWLPVLLLRDPDLIKSVTIKNFDSFEDHMFFGENITDPLFANNLISLRGDKWRDSRALLSPVFTSSRMRALHELMSDYAVNFAEYLAGLPAAESVMEMKDIFTRYANDVIATCVFGVGVDSMRNRNNDFYVCGKKAANFNNLMILKIVVSQYLPQFARFFNLQFVDRRCTNFFTDLVSETVRVRDEKGITRPDLLQLMMDSRGKRQADREISIAEMTSQAFMFFLGGFESSSTLMCFVAHEIATHADVQERLRREIDEVLEQNDGRLSYEAINGMPYLSAVISESLRLYAVTPMIDRLCVKDFEMPACLPGAKPMLVKKGDLVYIPFYGLQRDPDYFPEPDTFDPERFLKKERCNTDAYMPFGLGPRMCIGQRFALLETKALFFHLLARCELKPCERTPMPLRLKRSGFSMLAEGGFWLSIVPRKDRHPTIATPSAPTAHRM